MLQARERLVRALSYPPRISPLPQPMHPLCTHLAGACVSLGQRLQQRLHHGTALPGRHAAADTLCAALAEQRPQQRGGRLGAGRRGISQLYKDLVGPQLQQLGCQGGLLGQHSQQLQRHQRICGLAARNAQEGQQVLHNGGSCRIGGVEQPMLNLELQAAQSAVPYLGQVVRCSSGQAVGIRSDAGGG